MRHEGLRGPARLGVLLSGTGRTLENLRDRIAAGELNATIPLVIASRECRGADLGREYGAQVEVIPGRLDASRLESLLVEHGIDLVVLAGYVHLLPVPVSYRGRIVNIHPSLLPRHGGKGMYGLRVHEAVLRAGDRRSGCTVHLVDDRYDEGPIVLQRECDVLAGDTPERLAARVFEVEREAYPTAIRELIERLRGRNGA